MLGKIKEFFQTRLRNAEYLDRIEELEDQLLKAQSKAERLDVEAKKLRKLYARTDVIAKHASNELESLKKANKEVENLKKNLEGATEANKILQGHNLSIRKEFNKAMDRFAMLKSLSTRFFYSRIDPTGNPLWDDFKLLLDVVDGNVSQQVRDKFLTKLNALPGDHQAPLQVILPTKRRTEAKRGRSKTVVPIQP